MSIQFGMPTLVECSTLEQNLSLCSEFELAFVELNMNFPEYQLDRFDASGAKRLFQHFGKYSTIHLDENFNVCDFNAAVADAYLDTALRTIALAKEINAPVINMHMAEGIYITLPERRVYLFEQYKDEYLNKLRQFRDMCEKAIDDSNIQICIENCGKYHGFQRDGIELLLESPFIALTFDIGHDYCAGKGNEAFILSRANRLKHMHIHDATRTRNHLTLGIGEIDLEDKLALAQKCGCRCVLETKTADALRQSIEYIQNEGTTK